MAETLGVASSLIAVVGLSAKVFSLCLQYSRDVKNAQSNIEGLREEVAGFKATTEQIQKLLKIPCGQQLQASRQLEFAINDGHATLQKLEQELEPSNSRKAISRFGIRALKWPFKSKDVDGYIQHILRSRENIMLALNVDQTVALQNVDHHIVLDRLPNAEGASFDSRAEEQKPICLPNTRVDLLETISRWIRDPNSKTIFWLNGMAGTGKSTISRTVARSRSKQGDLGASFFFKRGEADRGNLDKFVTTVSHQLIANNPGMASLIRNAIEADPAITRKAIRHQFDKLVREPLLKIAETSARLSSLVLVLDAIDECEGDADIMQLISLFPSAQFQGPFHLRVFVTSRPELPVRLGFWHISGSYQDVMLHKIPRPVIEHDISAFLRHEFAKIRNDFNGLAAEELKLPLHWPGEPNLQRLVAAAAPLFIFAATICRFVNDSALGSPHELLQRVLHFTTNSYVSKLDMTYSPVLKQQIMNKSTREKQEVLESFRLIVGTVIALASPLSINSLARLLDVDVNMVATRLKILHSVLDVPTTLDSPVRVLHLSFRDYLLNTDQKETTEFWVDEEVTHRNLSNHCLRLMDAGLQENICGLSSPGMHRSILPSQRVDECLPSELQYACLYWVQHHTSFDIELEHSYEVYHFLKKHLLHWMEAMSLMGRSGESLALLRSLAKRLENKAFRQLLNLVADAIRFVKTFFSMLDETPLQIYSAAIAFAPRRSLVRKCFEDGIPKWLALGPLVEEDWDLCLSILVGHSHWVNSAVFSHDSNLLASASKDKTVRIWDAETGECVRVLEGHSDLVSSVIFFHDSRLLASASDDKTIRIWNLESGECVQVLSGHSDPVRSMVLSHESKLLATAASDKTVRIWNTKTGECARILEGHNDRVHSVTFSHDSQLLSSASDDKTIRIWDVETGSCVQILQGHRDLVRSAVFSHNSKLLASASRDTTVRIWDMETAECAQVLEGHNDWAVSVVFSHDSKLLASASWDETIRVWDAAVNNCVRVLKGHRDRIRSVVFSHDSHLLASACRDKTVRVWNAETGECIRVLEGHSDSVRSAVFSRNSKLLASASWDRTTRIWNMEIDECVHSRGGHRDLISSVTFSQDTKLVASASRDKTLRIWDAETGECAQVLKGHRYWISSVSFSHDSRLLASTSSDKTVRTWNLETGECVQVLKDRRSLQVESAGLITSHGISSLGTQSAPRTGLTIPSAPTEGTSAISLRGDASWVMFDGEDLFRLSPECQGAKIAVSGDMISIGCRSGRVIILRFCPNEMPRI